jgi:hypothetical protein
MLNLKRISSIPEPSQSVSESSYRIQSKTPSSSAEVEGEYINTQKPKQNKFISPYLKPLLRTVLFFLLS